MSIIDYISRYFILYQVFILGLICRQWYNHFGNEARSGQAIYKIRDSGKKHVIMILYRAEPDEARPCGASDIRDARKDIDIHRKKRSKKIYCRPEEKEQLEKFILEKAETQQRAGTSVLGQGKSEVNEL